MPRNMSYGFVNEDTYWDIGTSDMRGKDGDDARVAAKKYNDHRHSAKELGTSAEAFFGFIDERLPTENDMGLESNTGDGETQSRIRKAGDLVRYNGLIWMYDNAGNAFPLGIGPGCYFEADASGALTGTFRRESWVSQEFLCGINEIVESVPLEVGGSYLDLRSHTLTRARPMVRFECTGSMVYNTPEDPFFELKQENNTSTYNGHTVGEILSTFLAEYVGKSGEVVFYWDRSGDSTLPAGSPYYAFPTDVLVDGETLNPIYIQGSSENGITTQRSLPVYLNLDIQYTVRAHARLRTYSQTTLIAYWNAFISSDLFTTPFGNPPAGLSGMDSLTTVLGGLVASGSADQSLLGKINYWQTSHCTFEMLNAKIRIDNFLGLSPEVSAGNRFTTLTIPSDVVHVS